MEGSKHFSSPNWPHHFATKLSSSFSSLSCSETLLPVFLPAPHEPGRCSSTSVGAQSIPGSIPATSDSETHPSSAINLLAGVTDLVPIFQLLFQETERGDTRSLSLARRWLSGRFITEK